LIKNNNQVYNANFNNNSNIDNFNVSKNNSLSKFDKYSVERLPNLLHKKTNSVSGDTNFSINNKGNSSFLNLNTSKFSPDNKLTNNSNLSIKKNNNNSSFNNNYNISYNKNPVNLNLNNNKNIMQDSKFLKVSNDQLGKEYLKNKFLSESQRQKLNTNATNNEIGNSSSLSRNNTSDIMNQSNKNFNLINLRNTAGNLMQPRIIKISRNSSASAINNFNYNNNSLNSNFTNANQLNTLNHNLSEILKTRDLSGNSIFYDNKNESKIINFNPAKFKIRDNSNSNNMLKNVMDNKNNNSLNVNMPKNLINGDDPNNNKPIGISNIYIKNPENRIGIIENKIKENLNNYNGSIRNSPNMIPRNNILVNNPEQIKRPMFTSNINQNKISILDQEKEKEDKLFQFFLQYKNLKNNKNSLKENLYLNANNYNNNKAANFQIISKYQQSATDETDFGKLSSLNNSNTCKTFQRQISNDNIISNNRREIESNIIEKSNYSRSNLNLENNNNNNTNLRKDKINENIKSVRFNNSDLSYNNKNSKFMKITNNNINNNNYSDAFHQGKNEKRNYVNRYINNPNNRFINNAHEKDNLNLPMINRTYRKINHSNITNEFNNSTNSQLNSNANKISNTHENIIHNKNSAIFKLNSYRDINNDRDSFLNQNLEGIRTDLSVFCESLDRLFLNKKFKIFDELITFAYTREEMFSPESRKSYKSAENEQEIQDEKDLELMENYKNNENQKNNNSNKFYKINNHSLKNEYERQKNENNNDYYSNNDETEDDKKLNNMKINILKLNLFAIMRIFSKYKSRNFYFFIQRLKILCDNTEIFNTSDNFLYFDKKFHLHKLDNAVAYRKLQFAARLINNRRVVVKHFFKFWKDLVFNFELNKKSLFNSNNSKKFISDDYSALPLNKNPTIKNNNNFIPNFNTSNQNYKSKIEDKSLNINDKKNIAMHGNFNNKEFENKNNYHNVDKIIKKYPESNIDNLNKVKEIKNDVNAASNQNNLNSNNRIHQKFITDREEKNLNYIKNYENKTSNKISKPNLKVNDYLEANKKVQYKEKREINEVNKLHNNNSSEESDDMKIEDSEDEKIADKLIINNFALPNEKDFNSNNSNNKHHIKNLDSKLYDSNHQIISYNSERKNSMLKKILQSFFKVADERRMGFVKEKIIKSAFFKLFILQTFGETPLKDIIEKRLRISKEFLIRKFESLNLLDNIVLRRKKAAQEILLESLGYTKINKLDILSSIPLDEKTLKLIDDKNYLISKDLYGKNENSNLFKIFKIFSTNVFLQNMQNLADYFSKKLPKNIKIKFNSDDKDIDLISELIIINFCDDLKIALFKDFFTNHNAFEFLRIKTLNELSYKTEYAKSEKIGEFCELYLNNNDKENEKEDNNPKIKNMSNLFMSCDNSKSI